MTTHIRVDDHETNDKRSFACGIGPALPDGDKWVYDSEIGLHGMVDCDGCKPQVQQLGVPASSMNGNAAQRHNNPEAWANWVRFCEANGH